MLVEIENLDFTTYIFLTGISCLIFALFHGRLLFFLAFFLFQKREEKCEKNARRCFYITLYVE